ncbi:MAG: class I SAM-dependent DNA methyltransferase [Ignavibacteriae bacterium]|nr:class I SAM-dependent DNA methyltransferase [Ignavibacteriota bacterium]
MPLSWNEIKSRALKFSKEWDNDSSERAEAKTFWDEFFNIFGISRRRVATFEKPVTRLDESIGFIDLLWKGVLLVEHKSKGKNLDKAFTQAKDYFPGIAEHELPHYILVTDFDKFRLYNLEDDTKEEFHLHELHTKIHLFDFVLGYKRQEFKEEDPVNIAAANLMGLLHDALKSNGYEGHDLERFLVRILFILFADDTGIFQPIGHFDFFLKNRTSADGSDLGVHLANIFQTLNTPLDKRQKNLDEDINIFPYVNGDLFKESLPITSFDSDMRSTLLQCSSFDWSKISPAIFGSLFQSVMDKDKRRDLGAHYTSEKNIMKVIKSLFLDELHAEFEDSKTNSNKLEKFYDKISKLKFFDPACGCGNFLIIAYRELRLLEIEVLKHLFKLSPSMQLPMGLSRIDVDCMYGIEIEEFPSRIAEVAMWLLDHQMNLRLSEQFGSYFARIPLKKSAQIINGNSLQLDWNTIIPKEDCSYILGNPPFVGKKEQNAQQKADMDLIFNNIKSVGVLDYVTAWYIKASEYIKNTQIKVAFVSTNSIAQGEQVGILWNVLFNNYNIKINFAHRTFKWDNEAKGKAHVHVVIIGFANYNVDKKYIFDYETINSEPFKISAKNINPYLVDAEDVIITKRSKPLCSVPEINYGSMAIDDGILILTDDEKIELISKEPDAEKLIRPFTGGDEFLNNIKRWCLWLKDVDTKEFINLPMVYERVKRVKEYRLKSTRPQTVKLADYPYLFGEIRQPLNDYILIPKVSSETRKYIPIGIVDKNIIASGSCLIIPTYSLFHFGVISSIMHMSWMKQTCGRMKSDYQYSNSIVYNNYPWPDSPSEKNIGQVEECAQSLIDVRKEYPNSSLAVLYDPIAMPKKLVDAHNKLDKTVDLCYRPQPFPNELSRLEFLFDLYKKYTEPLLKEVKKRGKR